MSKWIPINEKMPDEGEVVFVTIKGHDIIRVEDGETLEEALDRVGKMRWVTEAFLSEYGEGWCDPGTGFPLIVQPIAWMEKEIPEPYEGGNEE